MIHYLKVITPKFLTRVFALLGLKLICTLIAVYIFARFSPLIDADLYLSGSYGSHMAIRTRVIQSSVLFLSNFGGKVFVHWFFGLISLAGVIYYYLRGGARWQICLPLFLPSTLIWTSVIGKEAIFYGAFTLTLVVWTRLVTKKSDLTDYVFVVIAVAICGLLRPHYAIAIGWIFTSTLLIRKLERHAWKWLCLLALMGIVAFFAFAWEPLIYRGFEAIEPSARASRFLFFGIEPETAEGFSTYKSLLPLGALMGIVGPMPTELYARPVFIPFFLEGIMVIFFPAVLYLYAINQSFKKKLQFKYIYWMSLVPAILCLMVIHAPFGLLNPGSATRWRVNFEPIFHMAPLLLLYVLLDYDQNANHSLSY